MGLLNFDMNQAIQQMSTPQGALAMGLLARGDQRLGRALGGAMGDVYQQQQATNLFNMQQMQIKQEQERARQEQAQREANQAWAQSQGMAGMPEWAQKAQFGAQFDRPDAAPASVREWSHFNSLSPQDQERYLNMKRAQTFLDLNDRFAAPSPLDPRIDRFAQGNYLSPITDNRQVLPVLPDGQNYLEPGETLSPMSPLRPPGMYKKGLPPQALPSVKGQQAEAAARGQVVGKSQGEAETDLADRQSSMGRLHELVDELSELSEKATYTTAGKMVNAARRQLGIEPGEGAIARREYEAKVDNEVLPLLRQTFGAAFTQKEGESLKATLGDPDASPAEKKAVLRAFIEAKEGAIRTGKSRIGASSEGQALSPSKLKRLRELEQKYGVSQ